MEKTIKWKLKRTHDKWNRHPLTGEWETKEEFDYRLKSAGYAGEEEKVVWDEDTGD
tara:strand:+ start:272 stop:439 length:168 start_codon:yes stop_codon:yes gene_type:complete